ncbi:hypothetical protein BC567DRAFT_3382 [Phyllosticta citribraziliensis]
MVSLVWLPLSQPSGCLPLLDLRLFPWCVLMRHVSFVSSTLFSQLPSMTTEPPTPRLRFAARLVDASPPDHQIFIKSHSRPAPSPRYGLEGGLCLDTSHYSRDSLITHFSQPLCPTDGPRSRFDDFLLTSRPRQKTAAGISLRQAQGKCCQEHQLPEWCGKDCTPSTCPVGPASGEDPVANEMYAACWLTAVGGCLGWPCGFSTSRGTPQSS